MSTIRWRVAIDAERATDVGSLVALREFLELDGSNPDRAIASGPISRFGHLDASDGGQTVRYSVVADYQRTSGYALTRGTAFASNSGLIPHRVRHLKSAWSSRRRRRSNGVLKIGAFQLDRYADSSCALLVGLE